MRGRRLKEEGASKDWYKAVVGGCWRGFNRLAPCIGEKEEEEGGNNAGDNDNQLPDNVDNSQDACTGQAVVLVASVISQFDGRLAVCECSNLKRIEHHTCGHGGSGFGAMVREVVSC